MCLCVRSLRCDQARPPAGDLGRGSAVPGREEEGEESCVVVVGSRRRTGVQRVISCYGKTQ